MDQSIAQQFNLPAKSTVPCQHLQTNIELGKRRAEVYLRENGYIVNQVKGQRVTSLARPGGPMPEQADKTECFVGHLPRDLFEDELLPHMGRVGPIYQIRLMMDFGGTNRGFAFVRYMTARDAQIACLLLNESKIRLGEEPIGVLQSFDNKRLYFSNLHPQCSEDFLYKELADICDGVEHVEVFSSPTDLTTLSAYVTFKTHSDATQARRVIIPGDMTIGGNKVKVDWAKPEKDKKNNISDYTLVIKNIDFKRNAVEKLEEVFNLRGNLDLVACYEHNSDLILAYKNIDHTTGMLKTVNQFSQCFQRLAIVGQTLQAHRL